MKPILLKFNVCLIASVFFCTGLIAQTLPYTLVQYSIRKDSAVKYGVADNFCGRPDTLKMNIYKPIGDGNVQRPIIIFAHGGGLVSFETFNEYHMNFLAQEFAKRGYVAASLDYREGVHLRNFGTGQPAPLGAAVFTAWEETPAGAYTADSAEVIRAAFRAQQDIKAAIRFMKDRSLLDSTNKCRVFLGGHSAGAISVLAAAFMDESSEKSPLTEINTTLPNPSWKSDGFDLFGTWVVTQVNGPGDKDDYVYRRHNPLPFNYDAASSYLRPDLGAIDGNLNITGGNDASIIGVASLAGAVIDTNVFWGARQPAVFMFHASNDIVVSKDRDKPFDFFRYKGLFNPSPNQQWPYMYGSSWINQKLQRIEYPAAYKYQEYDNSADYNIITGLPDHSHDLLPSDLVVADSIAQFFARVMDTCTACVTILPVKINFNVQELTHNKVLLKWDIPTTLGIKKFLVERSYDGVTFTPILSIKNDGDNNYSCIDSLIDNNLKYYRIKMISNSGEVTNSTVKKINFNTKIFFSLYPNPAKSQLNIFLSKPFENKSVKIELINQLGQVAFSKQLKNAQRTETLNVNNLPNGIYILKLEEANKVLGVEKIQIAK